MNSRAKKYFTNIKSEKKQVDNNSTNNKTEDKGKPSVRKNTATQDDTGGGNDSGKRSDDN